MKIKKIRRNVDFFKDELVNLICKYIIENTKYRYIVRDKNNDVYIYENKPRKLANIWSVYSVNGEPERLCCLSDLFDFVRWEDSEPKSIEENLKNSGVKEYD